MFGDVTTGEGAECDRLPVAKGQKCCYIDYDAQGSVYKLILPNSLALLLMLEVIVKVNGSKYGHDLV